MTANLPDLRTIGTTTFFVASTPAIGIELWKTDGTAAGAALVKDINPGSADSDPSPLTGGTESSTSLPMTARRGRSCGSSSLSGFTVAGSLIYLTAEESSHNPELWAIPVSALDPLPCSKESPPATFG